MGGSSIYYSGEPIKVQNKEFRIFLEPLSADDADALSRNANDYEIAYNAASFGTFPHPYSREHALSFIEDAESSMKNGMAYHFGIRMADGTLIGAAGVLRIDPEDRSCRIGYWLGREHWGKGYAREAVSLLSSFCFGSLSIDKIYANVLGFNARSISLLEGLGFRKDDGPVRLIAHYDGYVEEQRYWMEKRSFDIEPHRHNR